MIFTKENYIKMFERAILHLDLDAFFVSVECLRNSSMKGKPLIIGGTSDRGVVSSCSYEARAFGVHSAMATADPLLPVAHHIDLSSRRGPTPDRRAHRGPPWDWG